MKIFELLSPHNIAINVPSDSKKSALQYLCTLATHTNSAVTAKEALNALIEREKLGSTAIGHGVALPHVRITGLHEPLGSLIHLAKPINFDSPDDEPVDLLFALLMPLESTTEHLKLLSELAELFSAKSYRQQLRCAKTDEEFLQIATRTIL
jgi:PTS system nitrogen regulatory IIA component